MYGPANTTRVAPTARSATRLAVDVVVTGMPPATLAIRSRKATSQPRPCTNDALVPPKQMACRGALASSSVQRSTSADPAICPTPSTVALVNAIRVVWMVTPGGAIAWNSGSMTQLDAM